MSRYLRENNLPLPSVVIPDWNGVGKGWAGDPQTCERCGVELPPKYQECAYCDACEAERDGEEE